MDCHARLRRARNDELRLAGVGAGKEMAADSATRGCGGG